MRVRNLVQQVRGSHNGGRHRGEIAAEYRVVFGAHARHALRVARENVVAVAQNTAGRVAACKKKEANLPRYHRFQRHVHLSDWPRTVFHHIAFECKVDHGLALFRLWFLVLVPKRFKPFFKLTDDEFIHLPSVIPLHKRTQRVPTLPWIDLISV